MVDTRGTGPSLDEAASSELPVPSVTDSAAHGEFSCAPFEGVSLLPLAPAPPWADCLRTRHPGASLLR
ncbi:hypothetical protein ABHI18_006784 [Aspergillus niger]